MSEIISPRNLIRGFLAGVLAVFIFHQLTILILTQLGVIQGQVYSWQGVPPWGVPRVLNAAFWGGLYGVLFALFAHRIPSGRSFILAGFALGVLASLVGWFVVAPIKGNPIAAGWVPARMLTSIVINGMFGIGVGVIYPLLGRWLGASAPASSGTETA